MSYFFTSESVSEGHPDKVADQISDALLDEFLRQDPNSKVACETLVTTGLVVLAGEVRTEAWVDHMEVVREVIKKIGYTKPEYRFDYNSCGIISSIHEQSEDIRRGVEKQDPYEQGAGDQGMMFGYACREMDNYMPISIEIAHLLVQRLADIRREGHVMTYLRPDAKSQVTLEYADDGTPLKIDTIVVSTQHDEFGSEETMQKVIIEDIKKHLIPRVFESSDVPLRVRNLLKNDFKLFVNPTGKFVIGGPHGDTGLTGRKIIVDTYGGHGAHGGGAFSGKDPSKVDRSGAYAMRYIAKNAVAAGLADKILVQIAYAIGVSKPVGFYVNTYGTAKVKMSDQEIANKLLNIMDLRPYAIIKKFNLQNPIYLPTAAYGHFGREPFRKKVEVSPLHSDAQREVIDGKERYYKEVWFFPWEKEDLVPAIREEFKL
ncbi:MAG: methionine adenosyltransferase [Bacteroidales bacterium]|nr:methionine adenosyltransferase [Bacteroidales bacterium]